MRAMAMILMLSLVFLSTSALGEVPGLINYQGTLTDEYGVALDTTVSMTFSIYADSVGGTSVWTETQPTSVVSHGIFNALLGGVNAISDTVFKDPVRWLGIQLGGDPEMSPRQRIVSVGYAFHAAEADTADYSRTALAVSDGDWTVSGNDIYSAVSGNVGIGTASPSEKLNVLITDMIGQPGHFQINNESNPNPAFFAETNGRGEGVYGHSGSGRGIYGEHSNGNYGYLGDLNYGVYGRHSGSANYGYLGSKNYGVYGYSDSTYGVYGYNSNWYGYGVYGHNAFFGNYGYLGGGDKGVYGYSSEGYGVHGASDDSYALYGRSEIGTGVYGRSYTNETHGYLGHPNYGAYGRDVASDHLGYLGGDSCGVYGSGPNSPGSYAVYGEHGSGNFGHIGGYYDGVYGENGTSGNYGYLGSSQVGVKGWSSSGKGVQGASVSGTAVYGSQSSSGSFGSLGSFYGVYGESGSSGNYGYIGGSAYGVFGCSVGGGNYGYIGSSTNGVYGYSSSGRAGYFNGDVEVVNGDVEVVNGQLTTPVLEITAGSDLSEQFEIRGIPEDLFSASGMVVSIDPESPGDLIVSSEAYDKRVAGVISGAGGIQPGMLMRQKGSQADGANPVALTGRVYCWADASTGSIQPGDLLTTSTTPGHAMKASDPERSHGAIIGKAMSSLQEGRDLVLVLVNLQ